MKGVCLNRGKNLLTTSIVRTEIERHYADSMDLGLARLCLLCFGTLNQTSTHTVWLCLKLGINCYLYTVSTESVLSGLIDY